MTDYPEQIDDTTSLPTVTDNVSSINAASINRLREAIIAVERELGVNPSGTYGTVDDRLDVLDAALGTSNLQAVDFSVADVDGYFTATNVETVIAEVGATLTGTTSLASEVSITDADGYYASGNVEGALAEAGALIGQPTSVAAADLSVADVDGYLVSTNVEDALEEIAKLKVQFVSGEIEEPEDKPYPILLNAPFSAKFETLALETGAGTADGYIEVEGSAISDPISISTTETLYTFDEFGGMFAGDDVGLRVLNNSFSSDLKFTLTYQKGPPIGLNPPQKDSLGIWYDSRATEAGGEPKNLGSFSVAPMTAVGDVELDTTGTTFGATTNVPYWRQNASNGYYDSDEGSGTSNPLMIGTGEDVTVAALIYTGGYASNNIQTIIGLQRASDPIPGGFSLDKQHPSLNNNHTARFEGNLGPTITFNGLLRHIYVGTAENAQTGSGAGGNTQVHIRALQVGSSWQSSVASGTAADPLLNGHRLFQASPGRSFVYIQSAMVWRDVLFSAQDLEDLYQYFIDMFGEAP